MKLIVGLGNPGKEYLGTRHNVGFEIVQDFAKTHKTDLSKKRFEALFGEVQIGVEKVLLALPQTYMNLSGRSVQALLNFYKLSTADLAVVHDELDLPIGKMKVVRQGGAAGHRGVLSLQEHLKTQEFCRFRIGIGRPEDREGTVDFVLSPVEKEEKPVLRQVIERTCKGLEIWIEKGVEAAIQYCHQPLK